MYDFVVLMSQMMNAHFYFIGDKLHNLMKQ